MSAIKEFEEKHGRLFPQSLRTALNFQAENKTKIQFEVPNVGTFDLLDFDSEDKYSNPHLLVPIIDKHLDGFYPVINYSKVIPFARSTWGDSSTYLVVEDNSETIIWVDLDSNEKKPAELSFDINTLIDVNNLVKKGDTLYYSCKKKFKKIIAADKYFLGVPDCIHAITDYEKMFRKSLALTGSSVDFKFQPQGDSVDSYSFVIKVGEFSKTYTVKKFSDLISGDEFVRILNDILINTMNSNGFSFYELSYDAFDFGIAYANTETAALLRANGYLQSTSSHTEFSNDEKQAIENAQDFKREIENIEFHMKIVSGNITAEHKNTTVHFSYKSTFHLDDEGIKLLKKMTKINKVEKIDGGYNFFFYVE